MLRHGGLARCSIVMSVVQLPCMLLLRSCSMLHVLRCPQRCAGHGVQQEEEDGQAEAGDGTSQEAGPAQEA